MEILRPAQSKSKGFATTTRVRFTSSAPKVTVVYTTVTVKFDLRSSEISLTASEIRYANEIFALQMLRVLRTAIYMRAICELPLH